MADIDQDTLLSLVKEGFSLGRLRPRPTEGLPANTAGVPGLMVMETPELKNTNALGFVTASPLLDKLEANRGRTPAMFVAPQAKEDTVSHEAEHLIARRQLGHPSKLNQKFDELVGDPKARGAFVTAAMEAAPYLKEKYGISDAYFDPAILKSNPAPVLLYEQLATLAAAEQTLNVDLTKDPVLRKTLFKDPAVRETYNAITGLRQTRLDPRDIAPYTRVPEPKAKEQAESLLDKARKSLRFNQGGSAKLI